MNKLDIGMYVRTTYGIGKINKSFIVYTDDGYLWRLGYMTDNPKIAIGVYTKDLMYGGKIQKDYRIKYEALENKKEFVDEVYKQELDEFVCYVPVKNGVPRNAELFDDHKFIKASYNIIDLIEVGDIVINQLGEIIQPYNGDLDELKDYWKTIKNPIKSILTKEQIKSIEYNLGGNNE